MVFPNPAGNMLNIQGMGQAAWTIHAMDGRTVLSGRMSAHGMIDIAPLGDGPYLLWLSGEQEHFSIPFHKIQNR